MITKYKTDYKKGRMDELVLIVNMLTHYIRNAENPTLEAVCDNLNDRLLCAKAMNKIKKEEGSK